MEGKNESKHTHERWTLGFNGSAIMDNGVISSISLQEVCDNLNQIEHLIKDNKWYKKRIDEDWYVRELREELSEMKEENEGLRGDLFEIYKYLEQLSTPDQIWIQTKWMPKVNLYFKK